MVQNQSKWSKIAQNGLKIVEIDTKSVKIGQKWVPSGALWHQSGGWRGLRPIKARHFAPWRVPPAVVALTTPLQRPYNAA